MKLKKLLAAVVLGTFVFFTLSSLSTSFAAEGSDMETTTTVTSSGEAERAANNASLMGINQTIIEGVVFATALGIMAAAISSDSGSTRDQAHGHGH